MINSISNASLAQPAAQSAAHAPAAQPTPPKALSAPGSGDTVQISNAAKALVQEATESSAQTAQEARGGDRQALRLLAKEAAAKAALK
jgi:hypothetical protein